jgi:hypothetical protein
MERHDPIGHEDAALHRHRRTAAPLADTLNQNWIPGNPRLKDQPPARRRGARWGLNRLHARAQVPLPSTAPSPPR